jgi:2,5-furandicarboxylate decarboxylase 1
MNSGTSTGTDLPSYLEYLSAREGELIGISRPVVRDGEIAAVTKALEPCGAPAVLFDDVTDSPFPVLMGTFGTRQRLADAIGVPVASMLDHALEVVRADLPAVEPVTDAPVQAVVVQGTDVDLADLPFTVHSRDDAGPYITAGVVVARDPETGTVNTGMYRMMITGRDQLTVNAAPDHDLGRLFSRARAAGTTVPIAIVIGHHPAYLMASQLKNSADVDTHELAGALLRSPLRVVDGVSVDVPVPADAEIVLEGEVDPGALTPEGPFGEFSYYYGATSAPVCTVTAVTRKADPIFLDLHPTHPEHLCLWLFPGREARLLERIRLAVPDVRHVRIPFHSGGLSAFVSIRKHRDGDGKQAILAAFAADHFLKHVTVVDDDIDVFDDARVLWSTSVRVQATRDIVMFDGARGIKMDPSSQRSVRGSVVDHVTAKAGVDATRTIDPVFPEAADLPPRGFEDIDVLAYVDDASRAHVVSVFTHNGLTRE